MSGCGRKHRAKHLTRQFLNADAWCGPLENERLGLCMEPPHGQHVRLVLLPPLHCSSSMTTSNATAAAAMMMAEEEASTVVESRAEQKNTEEEKKPHVATSSNNNNNNNTNNDNNDTASGTTEKDHQHQHEQPQPPQSSDSPFEEARVLLPRKFHKVIWLGVKDLVVVVDGCIEMKPSPEQIKNFSKSREYEVYRSLIDAARLHIEKCRKEIEVMPQYASEKHKITTTSQLQAPPPPGSSSSSSAAAGATTFPLPPGNNHCTSDPSENNTVAASKRSVTVAFDPLADLELTNPNRRSIKHRQQYFFGVDDDEEEEEDDEENDEEEEEDEDA